MNQQFEHMSSKIQIDNTDLNNQPNPSENLMSLSSDELDQNMRSLAQRERLLLAEVLLTIREIDRRRLYLKLAYGSLFDYLTKHIGYSAGSAQRRIDAARLMGEVPEVKAKIEQGKINLTHIGLLQRAVRQAKLTGKSVTREQKQVLLFSLEAKSQPESEGLVAKALDLPVLERTIHKTQKDESVRLEITLTKQQFAVLEQAKTLFSHAVPSGDLAKVIEYLATQAIAKKLGRDYVGKTSKTGTPGKTSPREFVESTASLEVDSSGSFPRRRSLLTGRAQITHIKARRAHIPAPIKRRIFARDSKCTHVDRKTGKLCGSSWQLEVDHIQPLYAGGGSEAKNLRLLCRRHNQDRNSNGA